MSAVGSEGEPKGDRKGYRHMRTARRSRTGGRCVAEGSDATDGPQRPLNASLSRENNPCCPGWN